MSCFVFMFTFEFTYISTLCVLCLDAYYRDVPSVLLRLLTMYPSCLKTFLPNTTLANQEELSVVNIRGVFNYTYHPTNRVLNI